MTDLITRIEEHVIALQDQDVASGRDAHSETIALLREAKEEILEQTTKDCAYCDSCGEMFDQCKKCEATL